MAKAAETRPDPGIESVQMVSLAEISPDNRNPRTVFSGQKYDELRESVRSRGVIQPIILRPVENKKPFMIVSGERRFRACCEIAKENGGLKAHAIPAIVRQLSDEEAFDQMQIENLQRVDLTPLEEAEGYKGFLKGKGPEALDDLAARLNVDARHIRRRVAVLDLPKKMLSAWEDGKVTIGHLEALMLVEDEKLRAEMFDYTINSNMSVRELRRRTAGQSMALDKALFDVEAVGCNACMKNTAMQQALFGDDIIDGVVCRNPECFVKRQALWLTDNWKKFVKKNKLCTNDFRFGEAMSWDEFNSVHADRAEACAECKSFISIIDRDGRVRYEKACIGDKKCFNKVYNPKAPRAPKAAAEVAVGAEPPPRVDWHGEYFREKFYLEKIPAFATENEIPAEKKVRLGLLALALKNSTVADLLVGNGNRWVEDHQIMPIIESLDTDTLIQRLFDGAMATVMDIDRDADPGMRHQVAAHLGIDLQRDWRMTREYLEKKSTKEIRAIIDKFRIDKDPAFVAYLATTYKNSAVAIEKLKKAELIDAVIDSGADLAGKVPPEILNCDVTLKTQAYRYKKLLVSERPAPSDGDSGGAEDEGESEAGYAGEEGEVE